MIFYYKSPSDRKKLNTSLPITKVERQLNTRKKFTKKITKNNKQFLRALGFKT